MPIKGMDQLKIDLDGVKESANTDIKGVYLSGLSTIVSGTPVDKGRARNNWFLSVNSPSGEVSNSTGEPAIFKLPDNVLNKKLFFTNNLPYANMLEYGGYTDKPETEKTIGGFSKQVAPNGWVRKTLVLMSKKIRSLSE